MEDKNFNPVINAVVSIRQLAFGVSNKWSVMKNTGKKLDEELLQLSSLVIQTTDSETMQEWESEKNKYQYNLSELRRIVSYVIEKINTKSTNGIIKSWNSYPEFSNGIYKALSKMKQIGKKTIPENKNQIWKDKWASIFKMHEEIKNEAEACSLQLQLIEQSTPTEVDELTDTILKHIPLKYTLEEAKKYNTEYMEAYKALKKEASQKKNLWDKFLDLLAGGSQQTPAQRVMMQRWVDGEKGDNSL